MTDTHAKDGRLSDARLAEITASAFRKRNGNASKITLDIADLQGIITRLADAETALSSLRAQPSEPVATFPNECVATGRSCEFEPGGPSGEIQCQYCGASPPSVPARVEITEEMVERAANGFIGSLDLEEVYLGDDSDLTSVIIDGHVDFAVALREALEAALGGE